MSTSLGEEDIQLKLPTLMLLFFTKRRGKLKTKVLKLIRGRGLKQNRINDHTKCLKVVSSSLCHPIKRY